MLSHYERMPDASVFVAGGDAMAATLMQLYTEESQPTFIRVRALRALSFFAEDVAAGPLRKVVSDPGTKAVFVSEAAAGLVRCAGSHALEFVAPLLARHDSRVRISAIEALTRLGTPEVRVALLARQAIEADAEVRAALDSALLTMNGH